jgi:hypothetical protein
VVNGTSEVVRLSQEDYTRMSEAATRACRLELILETTLGTLTQYHSPRGWMVALVRLGKAPVTGRGETLALAQDRLLRSYEVQK